MKTRFLFVTLCLAAAFSAGCSGVICKSEMAAVIDANAIQAECDKTLATGGALTDAQATEMLKANAAQFAAYADSKTVNVFTWLFGKSQILASAEYSQRFDNAKALSAETAARAALPEAAAAFRQAAILKECELFGLLKDAKDGRRPQ